MAQLLVAMSCILMKISSTELGSVVALLCVFSYSGVA